VFFTGLCDYLFASGLVGFPPLYWIAALAVLALPLVLAQRGLSAVLATPLLPWCAFYAALTLLWFMWSSQSRVALSEVRLRLLATVFLWTLLVIFADARVHRVARVALLCSVFLIVALNVIDLVRPLTFGASPGRAAGFYMNPNGSAIALVLGMIMSVELIPPSVRSWYVCFTGVGVLLTFSRGGMAAWLLATALIGGMRAMRLRHFLGVASGLAALVIGALVVSGRWESTVQLASLVSSDAWGRLRLGEGMVEPSTQLRLGAASLAWHEFLAKPLVGYGVGATLEWDLSASTHNIYLRHLAEYGVAGLTIVPLLVLAILRLGPAGRPRVAMWLSAIVLLWGMFSHNLLDERHFLICIALVASISVANRHHEGVAPWPRSPRDGAVRTVPGAP
jgi:hypothetical protein